MKAEYVLKWSVAALGHLKQGANGNASDILEALREEAAAEIRRKGGVNMECKHEQTAKQFCDAIRTIASKPENLENLESYLSMHFSKWLEKFANTPEALAAEMREFARMEI